ncbi:DVL [Macleaya cordata]|uniref:DVL n=1 Tax=Macleaya cordata TaxID=56857 RepID=A0A200PNB6_MACCD|nr:DVL [Macleaya cordata]
MAMPRARARPISNLPPTKQALRRSYKKTGFRKRFLWVLKQQKTRFYILGRCISMLLCWHEHAVAD